MKPARLLALSLLCSACGQGSVAEGDPDAGPIGSPDGGARCGDGVRAGTEECDEGAQNGPNAGCERDCRWSCIAGDSARGDAQCDPGDPCKGKGSCGGDHVCRVSSPLAAGAACAAGRICRNGACQAPVCGDGIVTAPEECDDGANDGSKGCGPDCRFSCRSTDPARSCAPADPCQGPSTCNDATHLCAPRTPLGDGTACGTGKVCKAGHCIAASCGDGIVEAGEECDPPDGSTCDASCRKIVHAVCGNGVREPGEECDDGNTVNLDGCDATCRFEQSMRANGVRMLFKPDAFCAANAIGASVGSLAQQKVQDEVDLTVKAGALTMAFQFLGLGDPGGTNAPSFKLGGVAGKPVAAPPGKHYDGTADLDWWYTTEPADLDAQRLPKAQLPAKIAAKALTAGPGPMNISIVLGAAPVELAASQVRVKGDVGPASAPTATQAATPGHTPAENLDPALSSFASLSGGELCGNVSASSLAQVPAPASVQTGGSVACDEKYGPQNTMLDVIANGCTLYGFVVAVSATQPDQVDPAAPAAGAGGPYKLQLSGTRVTGCKDKKGAAADLAACLKAAAFSAAFGFTADRVILK